MAYSAYNYIKAKEKRNDEAISLEDNIYIALYGTWKDANDIPNYGSWAKRWMEKAKIWDVRIPSQLRNLNPNLSHQCRSVELAAHTFFQLVVEV